MKKRLIDLIEEPAKELLEIIDYAYNRLYIYYKKKYSKTGLELFPTPNQKI